MADEKVFKMREQLPPELQAALKTIRDNMLIALIKRNGGKIEFSCEEIDQADDMMLVEVDTATRIYTAVVLPRQ